MSDLSRCQARGNSQSGINSFPLSIGSAPGLLRVSFGSSSGRLRGFSGFSQRNPEEVPKQVAVKPGKKPGKAQRGVAKDALKRSGVLRGYSGNAHSMLWEYAGYPGRSGHCQAIRRQCPGNCQGSHCPACVRFPYLPAQWSIFKVQSPYIRTRALKRAM